MPTERVRGAPVYKMQSAAALPKWRQIFGRSETRPLLPRQLRV